MKPKPIEGMKLGVIGTGHVGLVTCASLAAVGHTVVGFDADPVKVALLQDQAMPFFEPGIADLVHRCIGEGRLQFTSERNRAVADADAVFICVGTPPRASGEANLAAVEQAARQVAQAARGPLVLIEKSTVPAGTGERLKMTVAFERPDLVGSLSVVSNPEFLREGHALQDAMAPPRILVGTDSARGLEVMRRIYRPFVEEGARMIETDIKTAELAKHACNAFLALKISYVNALARLCERSGADVDAVTTIMGADERIGPDFLAAGLGYGGYCFPKDLVAFERLAASLGYDFGLLGEVARINEEAVDSAVGKIVDILWNLEDKKVLLLGLAFKPGTDDVRFSPALSVARKLAALGAHVIGYDPQAGSNAKSECDDLEVADDLYEAARGAHCLVLCTEWPEFRELDFVKLAEIVSLPAMVDGRNFLEESELVAAGLAYHPVGRPPRISAPGGDNV